MQAALGEVKLRVADARSEPDEDSRGGDIAAAVGRAGGFLRLVEEILEVDPAAFEGISLGVGEVVGDDIDGGGQPLRSGGCGMYAVMAMLKP